MSHLDHRLVLMQCSPSKGSASARPALVILQSCVSSGQTSTSMSSNLTSIGLWKFIDFWYTSWEANGSRLSLIRGNRGSGKSYFI